MIRLAMNSGEIANRLRGVILQPGEDDVTFYFHASEVAGGEIERDLRAGKHVLVSAETGLSRERLQTLAELARRSGVQLMVANRDRYLPSRQLIRQQLDAGKLGEPGLIRLHRWGTTETNWLQDIDLVLWFFGKSPSLIYAIEQKDTTRNALQVHAGFPGGGMALIDNTNQLPKGDGYRALTLIGSTGAAYADDHQNMQLLYRGERAQAICAEEWRQSTAAMVQDFIDALNAGRDLSPHLADWLQAMSVADAVQQSLQTRRAIELKGTV